MGEAIHAANITIDDENEKALGDNVDANYSTIESAVLVQQNANR